MIKAKQVKMKSESMEGFKDIGNLLNQMTGMYEQADPDIVSPKIVEIYNYILDYLKNLKIFVASRIIQDCVMFSVADIESFVKLAEEELGIDTTKKVYETHDVFKDLITFYQAQVTGNAAVIEKYQKDLFQRYTFIKESRTIQNIIATSGNLKPYSTSLLSTVNLPNAKISEHSRYHPKHAASAAKSRKPDWSFIGELHRMQPLAFAESIDFKFLWIHRTTDKSKRKMVVNVLANLYLTGSNIFDIITSPDIDTRKLSQLFVEAINAAKSRMPGFDKAFKIIESATDLLDRKFNEYYRESLKNGKNSTVFIENFICDLANDSADAVTKSQLRKLAAKLKDMIGQTPDYKNNQSLQMLVTLMDKFVTQYDDTN